jgi:hypothetical protein
MNGRTAIVSAALVVLSLAPSGHLRAAPPAPVLAIATPDALSAYNAALSRFKSALGDLRNRVNAKHPLPNLPGQALYLARNALISSYKDLTDANPSRIGRPNKFGIPPAYFDADNEPLLDEYRKLFDVMEAPPPTAQFSNTPFKDVVDLAVVIARVRGVDAANAEAAGRIALGIFYAETNGNQNVGNGRSNTYKGSFQTGLPEDLNGRRKWEAIKPSVAAIDPDERACRAVRSGASDREAAAGPDRPDEVLRVDPDHSVADEVGAEIGQSARQPRLRSHDHEIPAQ